MAQYSCDDDEGPGAMLPFDSDRAIRIAEALSENMSSHDIATRKGKGGVDVQYVSGQVVIDRANDIFGFDGWSSSIRNIYQDQLELVQGKWTCLITCVMRIRLANGAWREDAGTGTAERQPSKVTAVDMAKKSAVTDALKRAMRQFGSGLGNSTRNPEALKDYKAASRSNKGGGGGGGAAGRRNSAPGASASYPRPQPMAPQHQQHQHQQQQRQQPPIPQTKSSEHQ